MKSTYVISQKQEQLHGMALGGIGTGSVEISPNGCLEKWQIFNLGKWACTDPEKYAKADLPDYDYDVLPFYIRTKVHGEKTPVVRKLCHNRRIEGFRSVSYSFLKNIETIKWSPDFPICHLGYEDPDLPVDVTAEYVSPFVPRDSKTSGMPGFYVKFKVKNRTEKKTEVSVLGTLKNPVNRGHESRMLKNSMLQDAESTTLFMGSNATERWEQNGSMALSVTGGQHSYICGDYAEFFGAYVLGGEFGISEESCLFGFRDYGELPDLGWKEKNEEFLQMNIEKLDELDEKQMDVFMDSVKQLASGYRPWKRLQEVRPDLLECREGKKKFLAILLEQYQRFEKSKTNGFGDGALCSKVVLKPGEEQEIVFLLAWNFPNHVSVENTYVGHRYNFWCENALDVTNYLLKNREYVMEKTRLLSETLQECSAPEEFARNWVIQLSTLLKCSWWAENGDFGIWEGLGSCGFHTIDITYYGSFMLLALFPDLQLRQMEMGLKFQREDGRVHHFFTPDFKHVDNGYDRVDMNTQFVLMVCRDYMWTGDREYLKKMWIPVVKAMESIEKLDSDGDGLPDTDTGANTYDAWKFRGIPTYIAGLWLAALTAAVKIADEMQEPEMQEKWEKILRRGKENFKKLWNGQYFSLWVDGEARDECLMSGQLDAAWYCKVMGIPAYVEDNYICKVLETVWKHNYTKENGLINASYPEGKIPTLYTYENVQVESNWSGIEYAISSMLIEMGYFDWARELAGNVENRYVRAGRIFNHEECGGHYYRPLAAWTMMISLAGFRYEMVGKKAEIKPAKEEITVPWFTAYGYGTVRADKKKMVVSCLDGVIEIKELTTDRTSEISHLEILGKETAFARKDETIILDHNYKIPAGGCVCICF